MTRLGSGLPLESLDLSAEGGLTDLDSSVVDSLHRRRQLAVELRDHHGHQLLMIAPRERGISIPRPTVAKRAARLSRFAVVRRVDDVWEIESGRSPFIARCSPEILSSLLGGNDAAPHTGLVRSMLASIGLLDEVDDEPGALLWETFDRLFLERTGDARAATPATFRFSPQIGPEPLAPRPGDSGVVELPCPDATAAGAEPWATVHSRRTVRSFSDRPLQISDLAELLWHSVHVEHQSGRDLGDPQSMETAQCPVPSTGALQAIRLWLDCHNVEGLTRGAWLYDPVAHSLHRGQPRPASDDLKRWRSSIGTAAVVGHLVLRHARLAWKYEHVAAKFALLDAGAALHGLQLAATGLGLGLWPIATGPTHAIREYIGLDADLDVPLMHFAVGLPRPASE